jgi:hypothetical protein
MKGNELHIQLLAKGCMLVKDAQSIEVDAYSDFISVVLAPRKKIKVPFFHFLFCGCKYFSCGYKMYLIKNKLYSSDLNCGLMVEIECHQAQTPQRALDHKLAKLTRFICVEITQTNT